MIIAINTKTSERFEKLLELLSDDIFDAEDKSEITDEWESFDEAILLELQCMVDSITPDNLFWTLSIDALIFS